MTNYRHMLEARQKVSLNRLLISYAVTDVYIEVLDEEENEKE